MAGVAAGGYESDEDFKPTPPTGDGVLGGRDAYAGGADTNEAFRVDHNPLPGAAPGAMSTRPPWPMRCRAVQGSMLAVSLTHIMEDCSLLGA